MDLDAGRDRSVRPDRDDRGDRQACLTRCSPWQSPHSPQIEIAVSGYDRACDLRGTMQSEGETMFRSIVVGTDGSDTAGQAVRQAVDLAKSVGATIEIVSAYEPVPAQRLREERLQAPEDLQWAVNPREDVDATLEAAAEVARKSGVDANVYPRQGDPADAILDVAEERQADLIVVGNKGMTGAKRFLLGSVPNKVSHHAPCSVLIIRTT
jgi:nucleotide-binding universal stress UspA family protein